MRESHAPGRATEARERKRRSDIGSISALPVDQCQAEQSEHALRAVQEVTGPSVWRALMILAAPAVWCGQILCALQRFAA